MGVSRELSITIVQSLGRQVGVGRLPYSPSFHVRDGRHVFLKLQALSGRLSCSPLFHAHGGLANQYGILVVCEVYNTFYPVMVTIRRNQKNNNN